ncbi:RNP1, partial [Symbiodinium microadriaticum]
LKKHFEEKFGQVTEMKLIYNEFNEFRGFGFVTFKDLDVARSVLDNSETNMFQGTWLDCKVPINNSEEQRKWKRHAETSVSVQKLPPTVTEAALRECFQAYGKIHKVTLLSFAGAAEVTFDTASSANSCLRSAPHLFEGEAIEVDLVQPPAQSKSRRMSNAEDAQEPEDVFLRVSGLPAEKQQPDVFKLFYHFSL